nr:MAG TPA: hypothetical protein [Caudoviricetes sp.]
MHIRCLSHEHMSFLGRCTDSGFVLDDSAIFKSKITF